MLHLFCVVIYDPSSITYRVLGVFKIVPSNNANIDTDMGAGTIMIASRNSGIQGDIPSDVYTGGANSKYIIICYQKEYNGGYQELMNYNYLNGGTNVKRYYRIWDGSAWSSWVSMN